MRYIQVQFNNGYPCDNFDTLVTYDDSVELDDIRLDLEDSLHQWAWDNVIGVEGYDAIAGEFDTVEDEEQYFSNLELYMEEITEEEYNELLDEGWQEGLY